MVAALALLTVLAEWPLLHGRIVGGLDSLTQFYPWYELLGSTLRAGSVPGWNPYALAGTPFAANPLSGWAYLPAMLAFTLPPLTPAIVAYQLAHALLATLGAYGLARGLGFARGGAALAAVAYGQGGLITAEAACCFAFASLGAWLPLALLGAALAARARRWRPRLRGWCLAGLALSQIMAAWPGQGAYYALLLFASFVLFAALRSGSGAGVDGAPTWPAEVVASRRGLAAPLVVGAARRLGRPVLDGLVPLLLALGLAAAGLLPRLEFQALSSLAGGYAAEDQRVGGWLPHEWLQLVEPGYWYAGLGTVALAAVGLLRAPRSPLTLYLVAVGGIVYLLARPGPNLAHDLFGLLPGFARLHPHLPDRIVAVAMLVPALLAGSALDARRRRSFGLAVIVLLIGAVFADLRLAREATFAGYGAADGVHRLLPVDPDRYYAPSPAARFLQGRLLTEGPSRYLGYGPHPGGLAYTQRFSDPAVVAIGVNNRGVSDRLLDVQGYDAVHLARYDAFLRAANGVEQNYHNADLFAAGLASPLRSLLAARYIVTPAALAGGPADPRAANPTLRPVFDDGSTRVLEDPSARPWAWLVHEVAWASADEALARLARGEVDPARVALLEPPLRSPLEPFGGVAAPLPTVDAPVLPSTAEVVLHAPDRLVVRAFADAPAVLVLSEVAYPGWVATVDGEEAPIYVANGLLRAVNLPPGDHVVELRFRSPTLRWGMALSAATAALMLGALAATVRRRPTRPGGPAGRGRPTPAAP